MTFFCHQILMSKIKLLNSVLFLPFHCNTIATQHLAAYEHFCNNSFYTWFIFVLDRGIPNYDYKKGTITFIRTVRPSVTNGTNGEVTIIFRRFISFVFIVVYVTHRQHVNTTCLCFIITMWGFVIQLKNTRLPDLSSHEFTGSTLKLPASSLWSTSKF